MFSIARGVQQGLYGHKAIYCMHDDHFYLYKDGYYAQMFDIDLLGTICEHPAVIELNIEKHAHSVKKQILDSLKLLVRKPLSDFNINGFLNFPSGLLDTTGNNFIAHDPDIITTIRLPYKYDLIAECPLWVKTLGEIFEGNQQKIDILQEFFGYCLTRDTRKEKALLLLGPSRTGKSSILHVLRHLAGVQNCSSVPLKFIANPQYTPLLISKLINIDADVSSKATEYEAEFKIITSGEPVSVNQKFIPTFEFNPYCKLVMAANEFPRITDHSSAFYKRLILIPCDRVFEDEEINNKLKDQLIEELSGILQWAIAGLMRLNKRGRFEHNKFMTDAISELREESNPVEVFFEEFIETDVKSNCELEKNSLYEKYIKWCDDNGFGKMSIINFGKAVYHKYSKYTPKKSQSSITRKRVWRNLKYVVNINQPQGQDIQWHDK